MVVIADGQLVALAAYLDATAQNGAHTNNGYDLAARRVNETGVHSVGEI